jgi:hypothetical protein
MTRDEMIYTPQSTGPVRVLGSVDSSGLLESLSKFIEKAQSGVTQQGLRWAGDFEGVSDLRYSDANPRKISEDDFIDWTEGTEQLQSIANSLNIRDKGRVRMLTMKPRTTYSFHHDPDLWRVHIPLITNPDAFMVVDGKLWHLPVGFAYLVQVEYHHLALNAGSENRIHIVFDYCGNLA